LTAQECGQRRYVLRNVLKTPVRAARDSGSDLRKRGNTEDAPPVRTERRGLRFLPAFVHYGSASLKIFGASDAIGGTAGFLRSPSVFDYPVLLEEGDRRSGRLLTRLARSHRAQKSLHPGHGQEDAILALEGGVLLLPAPEPDVQAERVDGRALVFA
jgi:hypothetical protein